MDCSEPTVSVVVPVFNSGKTIAKCLDSLMRLNHPRYEIIIVDDGSTDNTARICRGYNEITFVQLPRSGASKARNVAIEMARGKFIAFTDGDCVVEEDWLTQLEKGFTSPEIAGVGGDQKCPEDDTKTGTTIHGFLKSVGFVADYVKTDAGMKETEHNPTCNGMYRKEVLEEVGGFNEDLWPGEDVELDLKIRRRGYKLIYNPAASVAHYRPGTYRGFARMLYRYGIAQGYLVRKYGPFRRLHYVPPVLIAGLALLVALAYQHPVMALAVPAILSCFLLWFCLKTRDLRLGIVFSFLMFITLAAWNAGFWNGLITPQDSASITTGR